LPVQPHFRTPRPCSLISCVHWRRYDVTCRSLPSSMLYTVQISMGLDLCLRDVDCVITFQTESILEKFLLRNGHYQTFLKALPANMNFFAAWRLYFFASYCSSITFYVRDSRISFLSQFWCVNLFYEVP